MEREPGATSAASASLQATHVYVMAVICLATGLSMGYLLRGTLPTVASTRTVGAPTLQTGPAVARNGSHVPTLDQMKQMADKQAAPLLQKLPSDPGNSEVLAQIGTIYHSSHQFREAAAYYGKAVQADPSNVALRTRLAASLYRDGDVDGAIAQLNQALKYDPKDANSLFNLGMIRLQGKRDGRGALAAWQRLLKSNPQLPPERKATVQKLMADVLTTLGEQHAMQGAHRDDGHPSNSN